MSRRIWTSLLLVVALLALAPRLPQWIPEAWAAVRRIDLRQWADTLGAGFAAARDVAVNTPWVLPAAAVLSALVLLTLTVRAARRGAAARRRVEAELARAEAVLDEPAVAVPIPAPAPVKASSRPADEWKRPVSSGRRGTVRRLIAEGQSSAEIARVTRIGQDAVRGLARSGQA